MKIDPFIVRKHSGKIVLSSATSLGNGTVKVQVMPFKLGDTVYLQIDKHGDYVQETN